MCISSIMVVRTQAFREFFENSCHGGVLQSEEQLG